MSLPHVERLSIFFKLYFAIIIYNSYIGIYSPYVNGAQKITNYFSNNLVIIFHVLIFIAYQGQDYITTYFPPVFRRVQTQISLREFYITF